MTGLYDPNNYREPRVILEITQKELNLLKEALDSKRSFYDKRWNNEKDEFISNCCRSRMNSFQTLLTNVKNLKEKIK